MIRRGKQRQEFVHSFIVVVSRNSLFLLVLSSIRSHSPSRRNESLTRLRRGGGASPGLAGTGAAATARTGFLSLLDAAEGIKRLRAVEVRFCGSDLGRGPDLDVFLLFRPRSGPQIAPRFESPKRCRLMWSLRLNTCLASKGHTS